MKDDKETPIADNEIKSMEKEFWEAASCGEKLYLKSETRDGYLEQSRKRYELEPEIISFADFGWHKGQRVLEIGLGLGADHQKWAEAGADLFGVDLTVRSVEHVRRRFELFGLQSHLQVGDAENLPFPDGFFDVVYSWGVLMCTPDTPKAIREVCRVLKSGGHAKIMLYHKYSLVGLMLWTRYALLRGRPFTPLLNIYINYLESYGTKAYSVEEARELFRDFAVEEIRTFLTHGDLLSSPAGQRHRGPLLSIARMFWPRWLFRRFLPKYGLFMTILARKK
jgi:ubiquinone/menaquinone biosynthesis C-methylase UbiE